MKKIFFSMIALGLLVSACGTLAQSPAPSGETIAPSPIPAVDLEATAALMAQQTIQVMPTPTLIPSATPIVQTETPTGTYTPMATPTVLTTVTATQNPILLTLTATLGTGTPATIIPADTLATMTIDPNMPSETPYPRTYGTMPPNLPSGKVILINKANSEATISLHCTTKDGYVTYLEYPVAGKIAVKAPAGRYHFVVWVGGKMYAGNFRLDPGGDATVTIFKDHVESK